MSPIGYYYFTVKEKKDPKYTSVKYYDIKEYLDGGKNFKQAQKKLKKKLKEGNKNRFIYEMELDKKGGFGNDPRQVIVTTIKYKYFKKTNNLKKVANMYGQTIFNTTAFSEKYLDKNKGIVYDDLKKILEFGFYKLPVGTFDFIKDKIPEEPNKRRQDIIKKDDEIKYLLENKLPYDVKDYHKYLKKGDNKLWQYYYVYRLKGKNKIKLVALGASNSESKAEKETLDILNKNPKKYDGKVIITLNLQPLDQFDIANSEAKNRLFRMVGGPVRVSVGAQKFEDGKLIQAKVGPGQTGFIYFPRKPWKKNKGSTLKDYKKIAILAFKKKLSDSFVAIDYYENGEITASTKEQRKDYRDTKKAEKQKEYDDAVKERDEILSCGPNKYRNPKTGRCVKDDGKIGREIFRDKLRSIENKIATFEKKQQKKQKKK